MKLNEFSKSIAKEMDDQGLSEIIGGSGNTVAGCEDLFTAVQHLALVNPDMKVLDFGSGCGRLAVPMMQFLSEQGAFVGVDIIPKLVAFTNEKIASQYENCSFYLSGDKNKLYDKFMDVQNQDLVPVKQLDEFAKSSFDIISAFSVFTHLTNEEASEYLKKFRSLIKPTGKIIISCFLINHSSRDYLRAGKSTIPFSDDVFKSKDVYYYAHDGELTAVGYEEENFQNIAFEAGLEPFVTYHGHWCGRPIRHFYQDIVVLSPSPELPESFDCDTYLKLNPDIV
ncbi:MAG: class I SAM-dependent methyltransferase, partial [Pseudomonadales bacterium]|nr:class I SAM-dependent methyltransferase [Pseudomonadales bacterium]